MSCGGSSPYRLNLLTLRRGATTELPEDPNQAFNLLLEYAIQGKHQAISELLEKFYNEHPQIICNLHSVTRTPDPKPQVSRRLSLSEPRPRRDNRSRTRNATSVSVDDVTIEIFDINTTRNRHARSLLHMAVSSEQSKVVKVLLKYKADPNLQDKMGMTSLHVACRKSSSDILLKLIAEGGDPNICDNEGLLPLHWAASCGQLENIKALGVVTSNINHADKHERTALHYSALNGHYSGLKYLLETFSKKIDIDALDENGNSALLLALSKKYTSCVDVLLKFGANVKLSNNFNETVLQLCLSKKLFPQAYLVTRAYPNYMKELEQGIECKAKNYEVMKEFVEFMFREHPDEVWDLWTDLRNVVIDCAQDLVDCNRTVQSFPLFVKLLKFARSLGISSLDHIRSKGQVQKRMLSFSPKTPQQEEKLIISRRLEIETQKIDSHGEPSKVDAYAALDDVWKFLKKWMKLVKSYHSRTKERNNYRFMRRPYELDANDLRDVAPQLCSLVKGYHVWAEETTHYKEFLDFISEFSSVLKLFLTFNTELIFGPLDFLLDSPVAMIEFQNIRRTVLDVPLDLRKSWFYDRLYGDEPPDNPNFLSENLNIFFIDRDQIFTTSCEQVMNADEKFLRGSLTINFHGDDGMGVGVRREWFTLLTEKITDPMYGLFQRYNNGLNFQPTHLSKVNPDHLRQFEFAGKVVALMIYYKITTGIHFTRSFCKHMLGEPLDFTDVACIDNDLAMSLQWVLDNDISDMVELTFSVDEHDFGEQGTVELKPGGSDIIVTEENKVEYVRLLTEYKMTGSIKPQINSFLSGFYSIVPRKTLAIFGPDELELILCGLNIIDRKDWRKNTKYINYDEDDDMIVWFWEILDTFTQDELVVLLKFVTGYSRVPHGGFSQFAVIGSSGPIKISKANGTVNNLPKSSVCFNLLLLPEYTSKDMLKERLVTAMSYASIGFDQC